MKIIGGSKHDEEKSYYVVFFLCQSAMLLFCCYEVLAYTLTNIIVSMYDCCSLVEGSTYTVVLSIKGLVFLTMSYMPLIVNRFQ